MTMGHIFGGLIILMMLVEVLSTDIIKYFINEIKTWRKEDDSE